MTDSYVPLPADHAQDERTRYRKWHLALLGTTVGAAGILVLSSSPARGKRMRAANLLEIVQDDVDAADNTSVACWKGTGGICEHSSCSDWRGPCNCTQGQEFCAGGYCTGADRRCYPQQNEVAASGFRIVNTKSNAMLHVKTCPGSLSAHQGCDWQEQLNQCFGLDLCSAVTTWQACRDACCDDPKCDTWQWSGLDSQCWMGVPSWPEFCTGENTSFTHGGKKFVAPTSQFMLRRLPGSLPHGESGYVLSSLVFPECAVSIPSSQNSSIDVVVASDRGRGLDDAGIKLAKISGGIKIEAFNGGYLVADTTDESSDVRTASGAEQDSRFMTWKTDPHLPNGIVFKMPTKDDEDDAEDDGQDGDEDVDPKAAAS